MKSLKLVLCLLFLLYAGTVFSETMYVSGIMKITLRTGPGNDNKIVSMLESGDVLNVIQSGNDWTQVETQDGKNGWVLTRFITSETPKILLVESLKKENKQLRDELNRIRETSKTLKKSNSELSSELERTKLNFTTTSTEYENLKAKSGSMFKLEEDNKLMAEDLEDKTTLVRILEAEVKSKNIKLFLYGAGILVVGLIFGLSLRREKKRSKLYY